MKRIIIGAVLLLTTAVTAFSQTRSITVSGRVMEDDTKQPAMHDSLLDHKCDHPVNDRK